ncbi:MAG: DUF7305 domain-containing protein [Planctomycetota bacterium]|jgi:hypothetical protein
MTRGKTQYCLRRRGAAIASVFEIIALLLTIGTVLLALALQSRLLATRTARGIEARCAADAGLTRALLEMNRKLEVKPWYGGTLPEAADEALPNCDATYSYAVAGDIAGGYTVEAVGKSAQARAQRRVNATLRLQGPFDCAISTLGPMILKAGTLVDGYNSADPGITYVDLRIATASILPDSMVLNAGVRVDGEVLVGVDGDTDIVIKDLGARTGGRYAASDQLEFPPVTPPPLPDMDTDIFIKGTTLTIGPADSGKYDRIVIRRTGSSPGTLQIDGGDVVLHVTGNVLLGESCRLLIKLNSSLTLYLDGDLDAKAGAGINNQNVPSKFKLYGTAHGPQTIDLRATGDLRAAVYAPNADVTFYAEGDIYGAVNCSSFEIKSSSNFYYDEALKDVGTDDEAVRFAVDRWREQ